ncbi:hypothetical protein FJ251_15375 [bacterium]|nr:hypothetical protein [bacterium]
MGPISWKVHKKLCELAGWVKTREESSHICMEKAGHARPVVIPKYPDLADDILHNNRRTMGLSRKEFEELLSQARGR